MKKNIYLLKTLKLRKVFSYITMMLTVGCWLCPGKNAPDTVPQEALPALTKPDFGLTFGDLLGTNAFEHPAAGHAPAISALHSSRHIDNLSAFGSIREYHNWVWTEYFAGNGDLYGVRQPLMVNHNTYPMTAFEDRINPDFEPGNPTGERYKWGGFERFYKMLSDAGVTINICLQGSPISGRKAGNMNWYGDTASLNPNSYLGYAMSMFQHAARFGSEKEKGSYPDDLKRGIDPDLVRVGPRTLANDLANAGYGNKKKIGLGYVEYYENGNEIDHGWGPCHYTPAEFAAMTSACYDGHLNSMIAWIHSDNLGSTVAGQHIGAPTNKPYSGVGIKNADPNAKLVMAGTSGINLAFIYKMTEWFRDNRTKEQFVAIHNAGVTNPHSVYYQNTPITNMISDEAARKLGWVQYPIDVLNVHHYCPDKNKDVSGVAPEDDKYYMGWDSYPLEASIKELVKFRSQYYPNSELWVSEFGWDADSRESERTDCTVRVENQSYKMPDNSWSGTDVFHIGLTGDEVQGRWIVREYLLLAAWGVDRAQQFMVDDAGWSGKFNTSGFINAFAGTNHWKESLRPGWFYVNTLQQRIGNYLFEKDVSPNENGDMIALRFEKKGGGNKAYVLWTITSKGNDALNTIQYTLQLQPEAKGAKIVTLTDKEENGVESPLTISDGMITVPVNEKPVIVLIEI